MILLVQAASTMNQSDIRGLVCYQQARADIDILRWERIATYVIVLFITTGPFHCIRLCCRKVIIRDYRWLRTTLSHGPFIDS